MRILTFDIEEWFHIYNCNPDDYELYWSSYSTILNNGLYRILELLEEKKVNATFFWLGSIAKKYNKLLRIVSEKHEVGSHSTMHKILSKMEKNKIISDIEYSIKVIEDITGKKVKCFRAPYFSITSEIKWIFEILVQNGIEIDCSMFPAKRREGGFPGIDVKGPCMLNYGSYNLKEFPMNYINIFRFKIFFSGGGYFRIIPYIFLKWLTTKSSYVMAYFHPRDFDRNQPILKNMNILDRIRTYYGIKYSFKKFDLYLRDFRFISLGEADKLINWNKVPILDLNN